MTDHHPQPPGASDPGAPPSAGGPFRQDDVGSGAGQSPGVPRDAPPTSRPGQLGYGEPIFPRDTYGTGSQAFGQAGPGHDYATWGRRVAAYLLDFIPTLVGQSIFFLGYVQFLAALSQAPRNSALPTNGAALMVIGILVMLASLGWQLYNRWIIGGRTGQSLGKRVLRITMLHEETGQPVGALNAFVRDLLHIVDSVACVGFLWPLWDGKKQTFGDKIIKTVVVEQPS